MGTCLIVLTTISSRHSSESQRKAETLFLFLQYLLILLQLSPRASIKSVKERADINIMHLSVSGAGDRGGEGRRGIGRDFGRSLCPGGRAFELSCCPGDRDI